MTRAEAGQARNNRNMNPLTDDHIAAVRQLCQRFGVNRLDLFGSAGTEMFDPLRSDIDFIVEFDDADRRSLFERYFDLQESLQTLFERPVDLVMDGAMRNPWFIASANRARRPIYASALAPTA